VLAGRLPGGGGPGCGDPRGGGPGSGRLGGAVAAHRFYNTTTSLVQRHVKYIT
jgi:hypothetical protein